MGLIFHNRLVYLIGFIVALFVSCNDASYELDNPDDPENLGLDPPAIFFHPAELNLKVGATASFELYCYEVPDAAGAHLQIEYDAEVITIFDVEYGDFFKNGSSDSDPIMLTDPPLPFSGQQNGTLNIYLFYKPSLSSVSAAGTMSMAEIFFTVKDEGSAPIRYTNNTVLRDANNNSIILNKFGEGSINATQ